MTKPELTTRIMNANDLPVVHAMVHALAVHHGDCATVTIEELAREAKDWQKIIVACEGAKVVGYTALMPVGQLQFGARGMDMQHLYVSGAHRSEGVGQALIAASIAMCKELSCKYMTVGTHQTNTKAAQFYLDAGFYPAPITGSRFQIRFDDNGAT